MKINIEDSKFTFTHAADVLKTTFLQHLITKKWGKVGIYQNRPAFTLAEVLITLGVIGVVAAMTMPTLMMSTQNRELEVQLKKTYSELNQISRKYYQENEISLAEYASKAGNLQNFAKTFVSYYKGANKVDNYTYVQDISAAPYPLFLLSGEQTDTVLCDDSGYFTEVGGKLFLFNNLPTGGTNGPIVCVDINGFKGPNKFGMDYFMFVFTNDGFVLPMGQEHKNHTTAQGWNNNFFVTGSQYCNKHASHAISDAACAFYALQDVSPEDSRKSYWKDFLKRN